LCYTRAKQATRLKTWRPDDDDDDDDDSDGSVFLSHIIVNVQPTRDFFTERTVLPNIRCGIEMGDYININSNTVFT
jgi:hypothetical protein